jgi:hypothetical protein
MATSINSSGITFPDATTQTTAYVAGGGVTSITAGNGISVNASTGAVTVTNSLYAPTYNQVGSYIIGQSSTGTSRRTAGQTMAVGTGSQQLTIMDLCTMVDVGAGTENYALGSVNSSGSTTGISGTWRQMMNMSGGNVWCLFVRIA